MLTVDILFCCFFLGFFFSAFVFLKGTFLFPRTTWVYPLSWLSPVTVLGSSSVKMVVAVVVVEFDGIGLVVV